QGLSSGIPARSECEEEDSFPACSLRGVHFGVKTHGGLARAVNRERERHPSLLRLTEASVASPGPSPQKKADMPELAGRHLDCVDVADFGLRDFKRAKVLFGCELG